MDINELFVSPARICPSISFRGSCGNENIHYLVDLIVNPFGRLTIIGRLLTVVCSLRVYWLDVISV